MTGRERINAILNDLTEIETNIPEQFQDATGNYYPWCRTLWFTMGDDINIFGWCQWLPVGIYTLCGHFLFISWKIHYYRRFKVHPQTFHHGLPGC